MEEQGYVQILTHVYSFVESVVLRCTVQLGLVDVINSHGGCLTLSELAAALPFETVHENRLYRILRYLVHMRLLTVQTVGGKEKYGLTPASKYLLKREENSLAAVVLEATDEAILSANHYISATVDGKVTATPFELKHGISIWEMVTQRPEFNRLFNEATAVDTRVVMSAVVRDGGAAFQGIGSLVDVGGGTGMAAGSIVRAFPHIKCLVLDLPAVVAAAPECPGVTFIPGDIFAFVPPADAVFLKNVLHDWGDEECVKILKRCKDAIFKAKGKVIIVDIVMDLGSGDMFDKMRLDLDMGIAMLTTGKERSKEEWEKLLKIAGFNTYKITTISSPQCVIEAFPNESPSLSNNPPSIDED